MSYPSPRFWTPRFWSLHKIAPSKKHFFDSKYPAEVYNHAQDTWFLKDKTIQFRFSNELFLTEEEIYEKLLYTVTRIKLFYTRDAKEDLNHIELLKFITKNSGYDEIILEGDNSIEGPCLIHCRFGKIIKYQLPHDSPVVKLFADNGDICSIDIYELANNIVLSNTGLIFLESIDNLKQLTKNLNKRHKYTTIEYVERNHYLYNYEGELLFDTYVGPETSPPLKKVRKMGGSKIKKITRKVYLDNKGKSYIKYDNIMIYLKK